MKAQIGFGHLGKQQTKKVSIRTEPLKSKMHQKCKKRQLKQYKALPYNNRFRVYHK